MPSRLPKKKLGVKAIWGKMIGADEYYELRESTSLMMLILSLKRGI